MHVKTIAILGWFGVSYAGLLAFGATAGWLVPLFTLSIALAMAGIGFSIMHDANHGAYSPSPRVNRAVGLTIDLIGGSSYVWRFKHNVFHHTYANIAGMDADIDSEPFLRLAPSQRRRRLHRYQHLYVWFLYGILPIKWWFVDDFKDAFTGRIGSQPCPRPRGWDLATLLVGKAVFVVWTIVLPALFFRSWWLIPLYLFGVFSLGVVMSTVFQLAHCVGDADFHEARPGDQRMRTGWAEHQVGTTVDFARSNRILGWFLGGLNFQVEHHLFPTICHVHYPALATVVEEACRDHGVRYRAQPTLRAALAANVRWLRTLGRAPARPS